MFGLYYPHPQLFESDGDGKFVIVIPKYQGYEIVYDNYFLISKWYGI